MAEIVNDNKLNLILTSYGEGRIAEAFSDPSVNIEIFSIRLGSGDNYEYYEPSEDQSELKGDLGIELPVIEKALLEDEITISFRSLIPESVGNVDIREVGLYENADGVKKLFAISTQQPFVKPSIDYGYVISVDYFMFLRASNVAQIYDQIVLNENNHLVSVEDLEIMANAMLFAHGTLVDQIGNNSRIIGYNRATQLYDLLNESKQAYSYITTYKNYADVMEIVGIDKILAYWVFDYSRYNTAINSIVDISKNKTNLSLEKTITSYPKEYLGFMSTLGFTGNNYFYLGSDVPFNLLNEEETEDESFTMIFGVSPYAENERRTLLAKSDYSTSSHVFEVSILANNSLQVKLFTDASNFLTFSTDSNTVDVDSVAIIISYNSNLKTMKAYINGVVYEMTKEETGTYTHLNNNPTTIYGFSCSPIHTIYADSSSNPTTLFNEDGTPYTGTDWTISNNIIKYGSSTASYSSSDNVELGTLYAWNYNDGVYDHTVYTKELLVSQDTILYNSSYEVVEQSDLGFKVIMSSSNYIIQYNGHTTLYKENKNIPRLFAWTYESNTAYTKTKVISSNTPLYDNQGTEIQQSSDGFQVVEVNGIYVVQYDGNNTSYNPSENIPTNYLYAWKYAEEVQNIWANRSSNPTSLYEVNGNAYTGTTWSIRNGNVYYKEIRATYNSSLNTSVSLLNLVPYIISSNGSIQYPINSKVGLVAVLKANMNEGEARALSLLYEGTMGRNPYVNRR